MAKPSINLQYLTIFLMNCFIAGLDKHIVHNNTCTDICWIIIIKSAPNCEWKLPPWVRPKYKRHEDVDWVMFDIELFFFWGGSLPRSRSVKHSVTKVSSHLEIVLGNKMYRQYICLQWINQNKKWWTTQTLLWPISLYIYGFGTIIFRIL